MLEKDVLDAQTTLELPTREMMDAALINIGGAFVLQNNLNGQLGLLAVNAGQVNGAAVTLTQTGTAINMTP